MKLFNIFYGELRGYATVEEGLIFCIERMNEREDFLVHYPLAEKLKNKYDDDKKVIVKVPNKKKCDHSYKKHYGNSETGGVYCRYCGDTYHWDYRTEETMEKAWARVHYRHAKADIKELEEEALLLQDQIEYSKKLLLEREKQLKELGINVDDL